VTVFLKFKTQSLEQIKPFNIKIINFYCYCYYYYYYYYYCYYY